MVRIPLSLEMKKGIHLVGSLHIKGIHSAPALIWFAVDTGSPFTIISYRDCERLNMPIALLHDAEPIKFGGMAHKRKIIKPHCLLNVRLETGQVFGFDFIGYSVVFPAGKNMKSTDDAMTLPSLIGMDFLCDKKIRLVCDTAEEMAFLDTDTVDITES